MKKLSLLCLFSLLFIVYKADAKKSDKTVTSELTQSQIDSLDKKVDFLYIHGEYEELIGVLNTLSHHYQIGNNPNKLFLIQLRLADINRASQNFDYALQITDGLIENVPWSEKDLRARVYSVRGATYFELDSVQQAITSTKTSLSIAKSINKLEIIARAYTVLGASYRKVDIDSSLYFIKLATQVFIESKDTMNLSLAYYNFGNTLFFKGDFDSSIYYSQKALEIANKFEVTAYQILALNNLVASNKELKNYKKALDFIKVRDSIEKNVISTKNAVKINQLMEQIEEEKEEKETAVLIQAMEKNKKSNNLKNLFLLIAIVLVLLLAIFSIIILRKDIQIKKDLKEVEKLNYEIQEYSNKMSELNNSKDKILSIISHDLRSPFSQLITFLSFAEEGELSSEDMKIINKEMLISSKNGLHILDNLLYWANNQKDGKSVTKREFLIAESINEIKTQTEYLAKHKNLKIKIACPLQLSLNADKVLFEIVIRNLLSNAIKFSPSDSEIKISIIRQNHDVAIIIEDNGVGIPAEVVRAIETNNLDYRSTQGTKGEKGAGMGLYLSMEFARQNKGRIHFDLQKKGTKAIFTIPDN